MLSACENAYAYASVMRSHVRASLCVCFDRRWHEMQPERVFHSGPMDTQERVFSGVVFVNVPFEKSDSCIQMSIAYCRGRFFNCYFEHVIYCLSNLGSLQLQIKLFSFTLFNAIILSDLLTYVQIVRMIISW